MAYTPTVWKNGEFPPIDAEHLNKIEQGIANSAPGGFGLGSIAKALTSNDDVNDIAASGWYSWYERSVPKNAINLSWVTIMRVDGHLGGVFVQTAYGVTDAINYYTQPIVARRMRYSSAIGEWEYENPPMELGVEYRTTERYLGKPVYVKLVALGEAPSTKGTKEIFPFGEDYSAGTYNVFSVDAHISNAPNDEAGWTITMPYFDNGNLTVNIVFSGRRIDFYSSGMAGYYGFALLKYTKTTD